MIVERSRYFVSSARCGCFQPTKFMVGTEHGNVHICSRKAKIPSERVATTFQTHYGPVYAIQRHPMYPKHFLTIGDWNTKVDNDPQPMSKYHRRCSNKIS